MDLRGKRSVPGLTTSDSISLLQGHCGVTVHPIIPGILFKAG